MSQGRIKDPSLFYAALSIADRPLYQDVATDYALAFTRSADLVATPLGSRAHARFVSGAVVAQSSGVVLWTTDPQGFWVEGLWPDQNANVAMTTLAVTMVANTTPFGVQTYSFEEQTYPASNKPEIFCFTGATAGGVIAEVAFCPAQRNVVEVLGSRFWVPPNIKLCAGGTAANAVFSGTISITWGAGP